MAKSPQKINSFIVIDFETGGADRDGKHALKYPVTEVAALAINGSTLQDIVRYDNLIQPYDDKLIYDPQAAVVTGIDKQLCIKEGVPLRQVVTDLVQLMSEANVHNSKTARPIFVAHNWGFDRQFLTDIFRRASIDISKLVDGDYDHHGNFIPAGIDTIDLAKQCWADVTDNTTKFKLGACCVRAGIDYLDGHRAMNDVIPTADLFRYFMTRLRSGSTEVTVSQGNISVHRQSYEW